VTHETTNGGVNYAAVQPYHKQLADRPASRL